MTIYDDIKSKIRLSSIVSQYVQLKKCQDNQFKACCPFHSEKTPSFYVHDEDSRYFCFGCGSKGDALDFIQNIEAITHSEALKRMKEEAGIEDLYETKDQKRQSAISRNKRLEMLKLFRQWKERLVCDLVLYTNAQWKMYRVASRQYRVTQTEELDNQMQVAYSEAIAREKALDELESMSDHDLLEWFTTERSWIGIRNPKWVLSGWRKSLISKGAT